MVDYCGHGLDGFHHIVELLSVGVEQLVSQSFVVFFFVVMDYMIGKVQTPYFIPYSIFYGLSVLTIVGTSLAIAIIGIKKPEQEPEEQPGLTHTPKSLRLSKEDPIEEIKKWKELLDSGALTQEEFDAKKEEILNR